jgi:hypothetical protein
MTLGSYGPKLDTSPKRKRVHAFREFTRWRFGLVGVYFVSSCAQTNREALEQVYSCRPKQSGCREGFALTGYEHIDLIRILK